MRRLGVVGAAVLVLGAVLAVSAAAIGVGGGEQARADRPVARAAQEPVARAAQEKEDKEPCKGGARWPLKVMSDPGANAIKLNEVQTQPVKFMRGLNPPDKLTPIRSEQEKQVYRLPGVRLVKMRHEGDGDIHLVIRDPGTKNGMIVEFPAEQCLDKTRPDARAMITAARKNLRRHCGTWGKMGDEFVRLKGKATIDGVAFFDRLHGQSGVGNPPKGIELHPVLAFTHARSCRQR